MRALTALVVLVLAAGTESWKHKLCKHAYLNSPRDFYRDRSHRQPNIIYIMADDLGWNDVGFHNPKVKTPYIDELRSKGIELTQAYQQTVCSASRSAFLTGKYPSNNALQLLVLIQESQSCLPVEHKTLFEYMKELGYSTAQIGKWHLGYCHESCLPTSRGVDEFRGINTGAVGYFNWTEADVMQKQINGEPSINGIGTHLTLKDTSHIRDVIRNHNDNDNPLFMWLTPTAPHDPLEVTEEMFQVHDFLDPEECETNLRRKYLGLVSALDDLVGETMAALKEAGMDDNTIIVFSSDNGGANQAAQIPGKDYYANNYPLRNGKAAFTEGGVLTPTVYYDPRLHPSTRGTTRDFLMHVSDWLPTFVQLAKPGRKSSRFKIHGIDGISQVANLGSRYHCSKERKYNLREDMLVALTDVTDNFDEPSMCATEDAAYRWRDYKLIYGDQYYIIHPKCVSTEWPKPEESPELDDITGDDCHREVDGKQVVRCLFNIAEDPSETRNLYDEMPEMVEKLVAKIQQAKRESVKPVYRTTLGPIVGYTVRYFEDEYLVPKHDYCTPSEHFPLVPNEPECYEESHHSAVNINEPSCPEIPKCQL
ncbi:arylsulfatase B-like [Watersipora subatra]|uniref:arylsulfatase B-like n=1 Tax=Watersipora subatra TaxID=2589382 RepID=UPI00355B96F1